MTGLTLTKHHGLGNDFLVAFHPRRRRPAGVRPPACATARAASAPTGCSSASASRRLRRPHGAVQRRRQPGRDERQRHPLLRPGARRAARRPRRRRRSSPTPARAASSCGRPRTRARSSPRVDMGEVGELAEPAGWAAIGANPDRPVAHLGLGNPHTVVGVDDVAAVDLLALGRAGPARQPRDRRARPGAPTPSRCASTSAAPASPRRAAPAPRRRRGRPPAGVSSTPTRRNWSCTWTAAVREWRSTGPQPGRVTLTGPATFVATIEVPRQ